MIKKNFKNFSISQICDSGQCFRMTEEGDRFIVIAKEHYLEIEQTGDEIKFDCSETEYENYWANYFDLGTDYSSYIGMIQKEDAYLERASQFGTGIRILRQDLWEMIITFIISQQNNIKRIRRCIETISREYGQKCETKNGKIYYAFPEAERLAMVSEEELRACGLGYRSKYIVKTARSIRDGEVNLQEIEKMPYPEAKAELMKLCGIGEKVADCICLFALHQMDAFPVDVHIKRVLEAQYPDGFPLERFQGCAGVMQQYIFYYDLNGGQ